MLVKNALTALPGETDFKKVEIRVQAGKITHIASPGSMPTEAETLDAEGLMMFPGAIDPHVHFDEPGFTHREDFLHGSSESARGGVTTIIDMPCTSLPPVTSLSALKAKHEVVRSKAIVDYAFFGGISGLMDESAIEEAVASLADWVVGFKCYTISGMDSFTAVSKNQFAQAIAACASVSRPLLLHAEAPEVIAEAQARIETNRGNKKAEWSDYYRSRPMEAEIRACADAVSIAGARAAWLHIVHVGTAQAARALAGSGATCETCAHYLAFDEGDFERLGAALKTAPPVKDQAQKSLLWDFLADGTISFVASDHAGAPAYEKFTGNPLTAYGGIPGTGTLFPYLLSEGLFTRRLSLSRFLEITSGAAAQRYGLSGGKGSLSVGKCADFVLVDPEPSTVLDPTAMLSKSQITPFAGIKLKGAISGTFVRGACVYGTTRLLKNSAPEAFYRASLTEHGKIIAAPGWGNLLQWGCT